MDRIPAEAVPGAVRPFPAEAVPGAAGPSPAEAVLGAPGRAKARPEIVSSRAPAAGSARRAQTSGVRTIGMSRVIGASATTPYPASGSSSLSVEST